MLEREIQKQVFRHLRERPARGVFAFHVPNNPKGRKASGFTAGVPDIIAIKDGKVYGLELKREGGAVSKAQIKAIDNIRNAGGYGVVAEGLEQAIRSLEFWGLVEGTAA